MASPARDEVERTPGVGDGQGGLVCCSPWDHKELDMTERLNWNDKVKCSRFFESFGGILKRTPIRLCYICILHFKSK